MMVQTASRKSQTIPPQATALILKRNDGAAKQQRWQALTRMGHTDRFYGAITALVTHAQRYEAGENEALDDFVCTLPLAVYRLRLILSFYDGRLIALDAVGWGVLETAVCQFLISPLPKLSEALHEVKQSMTQQAQNRHTKMERLYCDWAINQIACSLILKWAN